METILGITNLFVQPATELIKGSIPLLRRQIDYMVHCKRKFNQLKEKLEELERTRNEVKLKVEAARRNVESIHQVVQAWLAKVASETSRDGDDQTILRLVMNDEAVNMINTKCWCSCASGSRYDLNLFERLKQKNTLLILDDVWKSDLNLFQVGIPCRGNHQRHCKVIITTRRLEVCTSLGSQKIVNVTVLPEADSWRLFRKNVGDLADSTDLGTTPREIAKECGGLPIALVTLGRGLRSKEKHVWETTLHELRNSKTTFIEGMEPKVFSSIKLSFDFLGERVPIYKKYFLLCCLFPEDPQITISELMAYLVGDDAMLDDGETLKQMTYRIKTVLDKLVDSCLLLKKEHRRGLYAVSMHDVIRDVAINIASHHQEGNWFLVKAGSGLKRWPGNSLQLTSSNNGTSSKCLRRLSLMKNQISELPTEPPELPHLMSLSLAANDSLMDIPDSFFRNMRSLATLDLRNTGISSLPSSISLLMNLKALYLDWCQFNRSTNISVIGKLTKLEILSLAFCRLDGLPEEIKNLTNLRLLHLQGNLADVDVGFTIPRNVISSLTRLEYLNMFNRKIKWDVQEGLENGNINASLAEVASLPFLSGLGLCFYGDEEEFYISFTDSPDIMPTLSYSEDVKNLMGFSEKSNENVCLVQSFKYLSPPVCRSIKVLIERVEVLALVTCRGLKSVGQLGVNFNNFKKLHLIECKELENVMGFAAAEAEIPRALSSPDGSFEKLEEILIYGCDKLKYLFSSSMARNLQNVEKLYVEKCKNLKKLWDIGKKNLEMKEDNDEDQQTMARESSFLDFPCLKYLRVVDCKKLKRIHLTHRCTQQLKGIKVDNQEWFDEVLEWENPTDKLHMRTLFNECYMGESLEIISAHYMVSVFNLNLVKRVPDLKILNITDCGGLKDVVNLEEIAGTSMSLNIEEASSDFTFHKLEKMILRNLPILENIWKGYIPPVGCFENLRGVEVHGCHKLSSLFSLSMAKNLKNLEELQVEHCSSMLKLVTSDEKTVCVDEDDPLKIFPSLRNLIILSCENLKLMWDSTGRNLEKKEDDDDDADDQLVTGRTIISILDFPCLEDLRVVECKNLKRIHLTHQCTQQLKRIKGDSPEWFEEVLEWENPTDKLHMRPLLSLHIDSDINWYTDGLMVINSAHYLVSVFNLNLVKRVPELWSLNVDSCDGLKDVFNLEEIAGTSTTTLNIEEASSDFTFPKLRHMILENLPALVNIWKGYIPSVGCFENLQDLWVSNCHKLSYLFSHSMARNLQNLERLYINDCSGMEKLIASERKMIYLDGEDAKASCKLFPNLKKLQIWDCENLKHLWDSFGKNLEKKEDDDDADDQFVTRRTIISVVDFPCLEHLEMAECKNLKKMYLTHHCTQGLKRIVGESGEWFEEVLEWENPTDKLHMRTLFCPTIGDHNWIEKGSLEIISAHYMVSVFNLNLVNRVPDMKLLSVVDCGGLKDVFNMEELGTMSTTLNIEEASRDFKFSKLKEMKLSNLPILENIWKGYIPSAGCFENLKKMKVFGCHKLSHLFLLSMARSLRNLQELTICGCSGMVKLIEEEDQLTSSKIFPKLRELTIVSCESLSYLWDTGNNLEKKEKDLVTERISILDCLNLQYLEVHECVNLKRIHLTHQCTQQMKEICGDGEEWFDEVLEWENPTDKLQMRSLFYDKVRSLHIFNAHNSVSVFDLNVTKRVPDMEILKVMDCVGLKNVFNLEETGTSTINTEVDLIDFTFSKLREMRFSYLPILEI